MIIYFCKYIYLQKNDLNTAKHTFCDVIGYYIKVYNVTFIHLKINIKLVFYIPINHPFPYKAKARGIYRL